MEIKSLFSGVYEGKKVFVTGHNGFKGSWLCLWLELLGAKVCGYSLPQQTTENHLSLLNLNIESTLGDIRDIEFLKEKINDFKPDIIFHLAAQPLVRYSYRNPIETFSSNVLGTLNLYEVARQCSTVKAIVSITTDKVYENNEWVWGYRENDRLGGNDPYSASKAAMEIMTTSYRNSFFNLKKYKKEHQVLLGVVRAGNVIGGGDWAEDRLIPDIVRATLKDESVKIRNPHSIRPWQHVLDPLSGYLLLGQKLMDGHASFADAFNFGPNLNEELTVERVILNLKKYWDRVQYEVTGSKEDLHEAGLLKLDCAKAYKELAWKPTWSVEFGLQKTIQWYRSFYESKKISSLSDLTCYIEQAKEHHAIWTR